jgi:hypothetical protein
LENYSPQFSSSVRLMAYASAGTIRPERYNDTPLPGWHREVVLSALHNLYGAQDNPAGACYHWPPDREHRVLRSEVEVREYLASQGAPAATISLFNFDPLACLAAFPPSSDPDSDFYAADPMARRDAAALVAPGGVVARVAGGAALVPLGEVAAREARAGGRAVAGVAGAEIEPVPPPPRCRGQLAPAVACVHACIGDEMFDATALGKAMSRDIWVERALGFRIRR